MSEDPFAPWYSVPLSDEDIAAGLSLVVLSVVFIIFYLIVVYSLWKSSKEIIGFRYLISAAFANMQSMIQYGLLDGIAILTKSRLISEDGRKAFHIYIDWIWFACCFHMPLIAWNRFHAVYAPHTFKDQKPMISYGICFVFTWLLSGILVAATHWNGSFIVTFYYEPAAYGLLAEDFPKYLTGGHGQMFMGIHAFVIIMPLIFYILAIIQLIKMRKKMAILGKESTKSQRVEAKLLVPCILSTIVFAIGQVAITIGTGSGAWATWSICFIFTLNFALEPVLLVVFLPLIRKGVFKMFLSKSSTTRVRRNTSVTAVSK